MRIIKKNNSYYIDMELYNAITKIVPSSLQPGDNLYFTKNAEFPRNLIYTSKDNYQRTILTTKATACIYGKLNGYGYGHIKYLQADNEIDDNNFSGEQVIGVNGFQSKDVESILQLCDIFTNNPNIRFVLDTDAITYLNSGQSLDENSIEEFADIYKGDRELFFALVKNIDIANCVPDFVYLYCVILRNSFSDIQYNAPTLWGKVTEISKLGRYSDENKVSGYLLGTKYKDATLRKIAGDMVQMVNSNLQRYNLKVSNLEIV